MKRILLVFLFISSHALAYVRTNPLFGNNMVIQQNTLTPVWGWADKGEKVTIIPNWSDDFYRVTADSNGFWLTKIQTPKAGGPYRLTIKGKNELNVSINCL